MCKAILKNQIIEWLRNQPYWLQFSGNQILEGQVIDENLLSNTLTFFKEENGLKPAENEQTPIVFNEIETSVSSTTNDIELQAVKDIENVNALISGQEIEINKNLTVIYGNNGTGKSGYIRLLNNAFYNSRGDKNILGNVFNETESGQPTCKFVFKSNGGTLDKFFPADKNCFEFSQYSVFDTQSVKIHLDNDNQLNFTPSGFDFFEKILQLFEELKSNINTEINSLKKTNPFLIHFQNDNEIKKAVESFNSQTDIEKLKAYANFSEEDAEKLEGIKKKIAELKALNIQEKISAFEKLQRELSDFIQKQQNIINFLTQEKIDYYYGLLDNFYKTQTLVNAEGIKSFEKYNIDLVGSQPWRDFVIAARNYKIQIENKKGDGNNYPVEGDRCLFCLQPISGNEKSLIDTYWKLLQSQAETELNKIKQDIANAIRELKNLPTVVFNDTTNLFGFLKQYHPDQTEKWQKIVTDSENSKNNLIQNLEKLNKELLVTVFTVNTSELNPISQKLNESIDELFKKKPDQEIATLTFQQNYLTDKSLLSKLLSQIIEYVLTCKWISKAENSLGAFRTNSLTTLQGSLFNQHITDKYTSTFETECDFLKAPKFIEIKQRNDRLKTLRKLSIANKKASLILSEGEQRAISLADFLTEVQLNPQNKGVVFDDPVTSLDHQRRALIAERLVKLAETKQVIIFTHDLLFVNYLKNLSELMIDIQCHWIEKINDKTGIVSNNNSPATEGDYKSLKNADDAWKAARKETSPTEREKLLRTGFSSLRTNYEYLIIFDLFQAVVLRFDERVSVERLKDVVVLPDFTKKLIAKVGHLSRYIEAHLHSDTFVSNKPEPDDLKREMDEFNELKKELKELRNEIKAGAQS
ncbi:AAA domain-containing protein [Mangrovibacterium marinum]|uniref:AAA domain-containing protein n=1 Tax=Mangrovibacterium marinum TaxID=1639118 RepID=A0A2T5BX89_9BACT|nr:AAA family ATPase [Mangrovibacterium marinum]PTN04480.1 AAA domain-containing protein [Mangrovibacterium marinum]